MATPYPASEMMEGENVKSFNHNLSTHHYPRQRILPDPSSGACAAEIKL
jgi:hypothetical protein